MKDGLLPLLQPPLVRRRQLERLPFQLVVNLPRQLRRKRPYDDLWRNAIDDELVQLATHHEQIPRRLLAENVPRNLLDVHLPVGKNHIHAIRQRLAPRSHRQRLHREQRPPHVPPAARNDASNQPIRHRKPLLRAHTRQQRHALGRLRRTHPHQQAPTPQRLNHLAHVTAAQHQPARARVLLHRSTQPGLRLFGKLVDLVQYQHLVCLLPRRPDRPRPCHLLDDLLHHVPVVHPHVRRVDLDVVR
mmetsp:Transcript_730/g.1877  ORF Transcript_730/g.1877 Transcript_730/m.1877 type:complete len:245 (-) Transcript_730:271-1005(-)